MDGFIGSFKGSLQTLIGWRKRVSATLRVSKIVPEALPAVQPEPLSSESRSLQVQQQSKAAQAEESSMSTSPIITPLPAASAPVSKFKSIMAHILHFVTLGLAEVVKYSPAVESLAQVLFPEYAGLEAASQGKLVQVATLLRDAILTVQQKYASAESSDATNAAKLADVLALVGSTTVSTLQQAGIKSADLDRVTAAINATVAVLKAQPAPAAS